MKEVAYERQAVTPKCPSETRTKLSLGLTSVRGKRPFKPLEGIMLPHLDWFRRPPWNRFCQAPHKPLEEEIFRVAGIYTYDLCPEKDPLGLVEFRHQRLLNNPAWFHPKSVVGRHHVVRRKIQTIAL